jgi:hypothetical protein
MVAAWAGKTEGGTARSYLRVMGGTDVDLTEYPGSNVGTGIPTHTTWEDQDLPQLGNPVDTSLMKRVALVFTVPEDIVYGALRIYNWKPASGSTHYWSDFELYQLTGDGAWYGDTGWQTLPVDNTTNFEYYDSAKPTEISRVGKAVYLRGELRVLNTSVIETSGQYSTNRIHVVPPGFATSVYGVWVCQGSSANRWQLRLYDDQAWAGRYGPSTSSVGTWLPFNVSWLID